LLCACPADDIDIVPPGGSTPATAYRPRRLVELAKMFGPNGLVQSICQSDFEPTMGAVAEWIGPHLATVCPR
jgi:hypothetical protein